MRAPHHHLESESPPVETGAEADSSHLGPDLDVTHGTVLVRVSGHDHVNILDDAVEGLGEGRGKGKSM